ncbi:MAG: hypothetical protein KDA44_20040 [Planctomycetales bacterium]|nr:hypothetical protein [Planctomycetales bacterium]
MKTKLIIAAVAIGVAAAVAWTLALRPGPSLIIPPPANNAYDVFMEAATRIDPGVDSWNDVDEEKLRGLVAANAAALADVRRALDGESCVPIAVDDETIDPVQAALDRDKNVIRVGRAFLAASRQAELDGDVAGNAATLVDLLRFSQAAARGGLGVDCMRGAAFATAAQERLAEQAPSFDQAVARSVLEQLAKIPLPAEDAATVVDRDIAVVMNHHGAVDRLMLSTVVNSQRQQSLKALEAVQDRVAVAAAVLKIRLAVRLFQLDNDRLPQKLVELVPEYLPELPGDPAADADFEYEVDGDEYQLHRPPANDLDDKDK